MSSCFINSHLLCIRKLHYLHSYSIIFYKSWHLFYSKQSFVYRQALLIEFISNKVHLINPDVFHLGIFYWCFQSNLSYTNGLGTLSSNPQHQNHKQSISYSWCSGPLSHQELISLLTTFDIKLSFIYPHISFIWAIFCSLACLINYIHNIIII